MEDANTNPSRDSNRQPLWKQVLGAIIGGALALALYYGYEYAKPKVTGYLTLPPAERMYDLGASHIADKTTDEGNRKRLLSRNARVAQQMEGAAPDLINTVDDHSLDIAWPGHDPQNPKYTEVTGMEPEVDTEVTMTEDDMGMEDMPMNNLLFDQEMATKEMAMNDWDSLWGDIRDREMHEESTEYHGSDELSDTGALASRKRKRKMA